MATPIDGLKFFSGIDFQSIVDKQREVLQKVKLSPIEQKAQEIQEKNKAILEISGLLDDFKSKLESLFNEDSFNVYTASISNESALSVNPGQDAVPGTYYIEVGNVASVQQIVSAETEKVSLSEVVLSAGGKFTIKLYTKSGEETLSFTAGSDMTIDDLIDKINELAGKDNIPISASKVPTNDGKYRLFLSTTITGVNYKFKSIESDGKFGGYLDNDKDGSDDNGNYVTIQNSEDAEIKFGSTVDAITITSSSNEIKDVIPGTTITVKERTSSPVTITIEENKDIVKQKLHDFVDSYNNLIDSINKYASYDVATDTAGPLFGDSGISILRSALLEVISTNVNLTTSKFHNIFQLGVYLNTEGHLEIRDYELDYILEKDFDDVKNLFTGKTNDIWISKEGVEEDFIDDPVLDEGDKFALSIAGLKLEITAPEDGYTLSQLVDAINAKAKPFGIPVKASMVKVNIGDEDVPEYVYKLRLEGTKTGSDYRFDWIESDSSTLDGDGTETYDIDDGNLTLGNGYENIQRASDALIEEVVRRIENLTDGRSGAIPIMQNRYEDKLNLLKKEYDRVQKEIERELERMREEFLRMEKIKAEMLSLQNTLKSYFKAGDNND